MVQCSASWRRVRARWITPSPARGRKPDGISSKISTSTLLDYPKPREGTETCRLAAASSSYSLLDYPKPREGTETHVPVVPVIGYRSSWITPSPAKGRKHYVNHMLLTQINTYAGLPQAPRGDGNLVLFSMTLPFLERELDYPKPREGTETPPPSAGMSALKCAGLPQAPRGDGN